ncbi:MAG: pilus assembly protein PilM, partial [Planctomycetota bacterium]
NDIADEAALCLRYYSVTFRGHRPERVLITGGDALEPGLTDIISDTLKVDAEIGRPLDGIDVSGVNFGLERREASLVQWACACGLALHPLKRTLPAQCEDDDAAEQIPHDEVADQMRGAA